MIMYRALSLWVMALYWATATVAIVVDDAPESLAETVAHHHDHYNAADAAVLKEGEGCGVRGGNRNPLPDSKSLHVIGQEEHHDERETFLMACRILNTVLPKEITCKCSQRLRKGEMDFTCTSDSYSTIPIMVGNLHTKSMVKGTIDIKLFRLALDAKLEMCSKDTWVNNTKDKDGEFLGDVCAEVATGASVLGGLGIQECKATFHDQECDSCDTCVRKKNNKPGLAFTCEFIPRNFCLPINLPIFDESELGGGGNAPTDEEIRAAAAQMLDWGMWEGTIQELATGVAITVVNGKNQTVVVENGNQTVVVHGNKTVGANGTHPAANKTRL